LHPAPVFHQNDPDLLRARVDERGLALVIGVRDGMPFVAHTPVLLTDHRLRFHLSLQNPLAAVLQGSGRALAVVSGEDAYISPDWYAAPNQVPTWNYLSVEIEGALRIMSRAETTTLLDDLSAHFEARLAPKTPWTRGKMDPARFEGMLGGIVGFEMAVGRLAGIAKLSQNKSNSERLRVAEALSARPESASRAIADEIMAGEPGRPT
jgi:transcriptional regulator